MFSFFVVVPAEDSFDLWLDDSWDVGMKFVVFGECGYFRLELVGRILSLQILFAIVKDDIFVMLAAGKCLILTGGLFQPHYGIDIVEVAFGLVDGMLGVDGVSHHQEQVALLILLAEHAIHRIVLPFLHYKLLSK
jgi:hypothetical protein